jgi:hypothetical protein
MKSTIVQEHLHNDQLKKCIEIFNFEHASTHRKQKEKYTHINEINSKQRN